MREFMFQAGKIRTDGFEEAVAFFDVRPAFDRRATIAIEGFKDGARVCFSGQANNTTSW